MKCKLPEGWEEVKLIEITEKIGSGATPRGGAKVYIDVGINLIRSQNVLDLEFSTDGLVCIDGDAAEKLNNVEVFKNDILINITGDSVARTCLVPDDILPARVNQHVSIIRTDEALAYHKYISYKLQDLKTLLLSYSSSGATRKALTKSMLENLKISLPQISEQKAIADTLSSLDNKIELNNKINENLEQQAQAIFKHWFVDFEFPDENGKPYKSSGGEMVKSELGMIPKGWEVGKFEDIVEFRNGYGFKSRELSETPVIDGYKVFKMGDIKVGGGLNPNKTKHWVSTDYLEKNKLERFLAKKGDLLMCMTDMKNNMKLLGHTALNPFNDMYVVNQRVGHITARNDIGINYSYLYVLTNNDIFIEDLRGRSNSGVQVNLTTSAIKETKIIIGDSNINWSFDKVIKPMMEIIFLLEEQNQKLSQLRDTLLPKLMSGELRIPLD